MADTPEKLMTAPDEAEDAAPGSTQAGATGGRRAFTLGQRLQIFLASWVGYFAVLLIGPSLRWEIVGWENYEAARQLKKSLIFAIWHCEILASTWFWRKRGMVVMASQNFDGEYIARIIQMYGFRAARGSSSRGGLRALVEMIRAVKNGSEAGFTMDGPRGPRHVVKQGVVMLAKATGAPILCFHIVPGKKWVLRKSWDKTEIPRPFSRTAIFIAPPITVPTEADDDQQTAKVREVQETMDGLLRRGEEWLGGQRGVQQV